MLKTQAGTVFAKVIQCFEKSNTRMNTKHSEKKSNTKSYQTQNKWIERKIINLDKNDEIIQD